MYRILVALAVAVSILGLTATQALAFDCIVANKPVGAGSALTVNIDTGTITANKPNPGTFDNMHSGFVTLTGTLPDGTSATGDTFVHAPTNAQASFAEPGVNPGATKQELMGKGCDGKGLDTFETCFLGGQ
ncbi:MAG: hypothetical protein ACYC3S_16355 [Chloroflexota bacterium]